MPGKSKSGKKARAGGGTIESADAKVMATAKGHGGTTKKATSASDADIEKSLHANLLELAQHSVSCFEYASKHTQRTGKGCVFWLFPDYESSIAREKGGVAPALQYHSKERAMASEYSPVIEMIEKYDPNNAFVALVAIRTGDKRDSLMKVMMIGAQAQAQMDFPQPRRYEHLQFVGTGADRSTFAIAEGCMFCSNTLCWKVEAKSDTFARCAGCKCKKYCGRECQVMHWKLEHKQQCATDRANLERMVDAHMRIVAAQEAAKATAKAKANANGNAAAAVDAKDGSSSSSADAAAAAAGGGGGAAAVTVSDPVTAAALASAALRPIMRAGMDNGLVPGTDIPSKITKAINVKDAPAPVTAPAAAAAAAADAKTVAAPASASAAGK